MNLLVALVLVTGVACHFTIHAFTISQHTYVPWQKKKQIKIVQYNDMSNSRYIHMSQQYQLQSSSNNDNESSNYEVNGSVNKKCDKIDPDTTTNNVNNRRRQVLSIPLMTLLTTVFDTKPSSARGLVQFPCTNGLANTYHFLRVGQTMLEEEDIWSTNPLFLTNREDALTDLGKEQVIAACQQLAMLDRAPTLVKYSLAASCIDTSNIVQSELKLGRERIVPEFTFLDPRGVGQWDMMSKTDIEPAVWALDHDDAGVDGIHGRPPANDDGTPNETLSEQATRLRQILSILETQYSGDTILLIFPDGTGPALLSAMIAGIPYNRVHQLDYLPGEVRFDITYQSTKALLEKRNTQLAVGRGTSTYNVKLQEGRDTLAKLRSSDGDIVGGGYVNLKDAKLESERLAVEKVVEEKYRQRRIAENNAESARKVRQQQLNDVSEQSRLMRMQQQQQQGGSSNVPILSVGSILAVGGIGMSAMRRSNDEPILDKLEDTIEGNRKTNEATALGNNPSNVAVPILYTQIDGDNRSSLYQSHATATTNTPPVIVDPKEVADRAMQDYLDRDDGANDFIQMMSDLIDETIFDEDMIDTTNTVSISSESSSYSSPSNRTSMSP